MIPERHQKKAAWLAICVVGCAGFFGLKGFEGERTTPYRDVGGVPTVCYGETKGINMGDKFTHEQCEQMLVARLERDYGPGVDRCTTVALPPKRKAAAVDFAYNLGVKKYCDKIAPLLNSGHTREACDKMLEFNKSDGKVYRGLTIRRQQERDLCMEGLT